MRWLALALALAACRDVECSAPPLEITIPPPFSALDEWSMMQAVDRFNECHGDGTAVYVRTHLPSGEAQHTWTVADYLRSLAEHDYACVPPDAVSEECEID